MKIVILNAQGLREEYDSLDDAIMKLSKEIISLREEIKTLENSLAIVIEKNIELQKALEAK